MACSLLIAPTLSPASADVLASASLARRSVTVAAGIVPGGALLGEQRVEVGERRRDHEGELDLVAVAGDVGDVQLPGVLAERQLGGIERQRVDLGAVELGLAHGGAARARRRVGAGRRDVRQRCGRCWLLATDAGRPRGGRRPSCRSRPGSRGTARTAATTVAAAWSNFVSGAVQRDVRVRARPERATGSTRSSRSPGWRRSGRARARHRPRGRSCWRAGRAVAPAVAAWLSAVDRRPDGRARRCRRRRSHGGARCWRLRW